MSSKAIAGAAMAALLSAGITYVVTRPAPPPSTIADERASLQARVAELEVELAKPPPEPAPCAACAAIQAQAAQQKPAQPKAVPKPKPAPDGESPATLEDWLALGSKGKLPPGLAEWIDADPARLLEIALALGSLDDPQLAKALGNLLKQKKGLLRTDVQEALLQLGTSPGASPDAQIMALGLLTDALRQDALAHERLTIVDKQALDSLARTGPDAVRRKAIDVLLQMPDDPTAVATFAGVWNDATLPEKARSQAIVGLRFAPQDVALPILLDAITGSEQPLPLRQQAAVSLTYLNPSDAEDQVFARLAASLGAEKDWIAKGFAFVAMMQINNARASAVLRDLQQREPDPWEQQKYAALAEIASRESDYQRIVWQGIRAYREIEARKAQAQGQ